MGPSNKLVVQVIFFEKRICEFTFGIGVGVLSIVFALAVLVYPGIGIVLAGILNGIALLITSIQIISAGVTGEQRTPKSI